MRNLNNTTHSKKRLIKNLLFLSLFFIFSCEKDETLIQPEKNKREILSKNVADFRERLDLIKQSFYQQHLDTILVSKVDKKFQWVPDWENPKFEIVSDSVSYLYYAINAYIEKDGIKMKGREFGARTYLIVKNEKEFYKGSYISDLSTSNKTANFKELDLRNFKGHLILANLQTKKSFIIDYENGKPSLEYQKKGKLLLKKFGSMSNLLSRYETVCHNEMRNCVYYTYGCGTFEYHLDYNCNRPSDCQASCGCSTWELGDYEYHQICQDIWFPDPPTTPDNPPSGDPDPSTLTEEQITEAAVYDDGKPKIADIKKYTKCFNDGKQAQSYTMTIFVDQPVAGQDDWFKVLTPGVATNNPFGVPTGIVWTTPDGTFFDVGHTFVTFEKNNFDGTNVRQTLGFYPSSNPLMSTGAMENNSNHQADVSYTINVTQTQFNAALAKVEDDFASKMYVLTNISGNEYNCTDAAISWMNAAGANFLNSSTGLFRNTPGSFGQVLRAKSGANTSPGSGIQGKGECN